MQRLDQTLLDALEVTAATTPRRRANHNIHPRLDAPVQRFFNALQPDTYVRPHRHSTPPRWELFLVLRGHLVLLVFDANGRVIEREELSARGQVFGIEVPEGTWHALVALEPAVVFELKEGPYQAATDKDFAAWAPAEGEPDCGRFVTWYRSAQPGDSPPGREVI